MIAVFALAQLADGISAVVAVLIHPAFREMNLLPGALLGRPEWALAIKVVGMLCVLAAILVIDRTRPRLATGLLAFGIIAGSIGFISNMAVLAA